jgi:hypothetical protein
MRYLCTLWFDGGRLDALPQAEKDAIDRESIDHDRDLERRGILIRAEALQGPAAAKTVRVSSGKASSTDGPFIETKEHLCGFILIEAPTMEAAVALSAEIPLAKRGIATIEVRPIYEVPYPEAS